MDYTDTTIKEKRLVDVETNASEEDKRNERLGSDDRRGRRAGDEVRREEHKAPRMAEAV